MKWGKIHGGCSAWFCEVNKGGGVPPLKRIEEREDQIKKKKNVLKGRNESLTRRVRCSESYFQFLPLESLSESELGDLSRVGCPGPGRLSGGPTTSVSAGYTSKSGNP